MTAPKILVAYMWSTGIQGKPIQIKLLTVVLNNIELCNQRYVNILLCMILYLWNSEAEHYHSAFTERWTETIGEWWTETNEVSFAQRSQQITGQTTEPQCTGFTSYTRPIHRTTARYHDFDFKATIECKLNVLWVEGIQYITSANCHLKNRVLVSTFLFQ